MSGRMARHGPMPGQRPEPSGLWRCGFQGALRGPQETSSLGTALDSKLEAGKPRVAPSPRIAGVLCVYW